MRQTDLRIARFVQTYGFHNCRGIQSATRMHFARSEKENYRQNSNPRKRERGKLERCGNKNGKNSEICSSRLNQDAIRALPVRDMNESLHDLRIIYCQMCVTCRETKYICENNKENAIPSSNVPWECECVCVPFYHQQFFFHFFLTQFCSLEMLFCAVSYVWFRK